MADDLRVSVELSGKPFVLGKVETVKPHARPCPECRGPILEAGPRLCNRCLELERCIAAYEAELEAARAEAAEYLAMEATREKFWSEEE